MSATSPTVFRARSTFGWLRLWLPAALILAVLPAFAGEYWLNSILIPTMTMALAGVGLNLLMGYAGLVSLGSAAFMSIGAFATYNLLLRAAWLPLPFALVLAGLIAAVAGLLFGLPSLRIKGFYLGASTLGAQFFFDWLFTSYRWFSNNSLTLTISAPRLDLFGLDLRSAPGRYLLVVAVTAGLLWLAAARAEGAHQGEQLYPVLTYRTGPYAPSGIPFLGGLQDYVRCVNEVEGGVNGVKIYTPECETAYTIERGIECYERFKHGYEGAPTAIFQPHSSGLDAALLDKARQDHVPVFGPGGGQAHAFEGRVFPFSFPLVLDYWSEASIVVTYIAQQVGGFDHLKGVKIATLYHDSGYGRDTIEPLAILSQKYGFEDIQIPVPHPGEQQQTQWQQIKQAQADWVFLRGWGVMNPAAIKTAARVGFPVNHIIGDIWSGSEDDTRPAGAVAKGYLAVSVFPPGTDYGILQKLKTSILDAGKSDLKDKSKFGTVYYNFGVIEGILAVETFRTGQAKFGHRPLNTDEGQWALEHLDVTPERIAEIGATGLVSPIKLSWVDHVGGGSAKIQQWTGTEWKPLTDWIVADRALFHDTLEQKALDYAKEKGLPLRTDPDAAIN